MNKLAVEFIIKGGGKIVDIGQLEVSAKRWLKSEIKAGRIASFITHDFPTPKKAYTATFTGLASYTEDFQK